MAAVFHTRTIAADRKNVIAKWYEVSPSEMTITTTGSVCRITERMHLFLGRRGCDDCNACC
jgi:hypothetical protein